MVDGLDVVLEEVESLLGNFVVGVAEIVNKGDPVLQHFEVAFLILVADKVRTVLTLVAIHTAFLFVVIVFDAHAVSVDVLELEVTAVATELFHLVN